MSMSREMCGEIKPYPKIRPDFGPAQITSVDELSRGITVEAVHTRQGAEHSAERLSIVALGRCYESFEGNFISARPGQGESIDAPDWMIVAKDGGDGAVVYEDRFMADDGLVPYRDTDGNVPVWNPSNYLRRIAPEMPTD